MPCAGNSDADHIDTGSRFASRQSFVRGLSAYAKEAAAIRTAKRACDTAARQGDPVRHVPFAIHADDGIFFERADPARWQKTHARRDVWDFAQSLTVPVAIDPQDRARQAIDQPKKSVAPTRTLKVPPSRQCM